MQATFLLGPAGSGKTRRCLAEVRAALLHSPLGLPLVLLAPKQATFELERQLLGVWPDSEPLPGYTRLQILSFDRLAEFVLAESSPSPPQWLDEEGRVMVLRALLARHQDELQIYRATARLPGFARQLSDLLREFQRHLHSPERLSALAARPATRPQLAAKLRDLALILKAYLHWLKERGLQDADSLLGMATETLRAQSAPASFRLGGLWLDGFAEMTPQEIQFLAALTPLCQHATLAFCLEDVPRAESSWLSTWSLVTQTFRSCHQRLQTAKDCQITIEVLPRRAGCGRFRDSPALAHLERHWADPRPFGGDAGVAGDGNPSPAGIGPAESLCVAVCPTQEAESELAAREILRHVRAGGRYRDCAVLLRTLDLHHHVLRRVFRRFQIPFFVDRREPMAHHPLAELTRYSLRTLAFGWRHDDWFGALKTGLVPAKEEDLDLLENEALARGWVGRETWSEPLKMDGDESLAGRLEPVRHRLLPPFQQLGDRLSAGPDGRPAGPTGSQLVGALIEFWTELNVEKTLEQWSLAVPSSPVHQTVWQQMQSWLANLDLAFRDESLPLRDWLPIVEAGLAGLTVGVVPPAIDQVLVGAVDRSRHPELLLSVVLGLNESVFPATPACVGLLTESDRDQLAEADVALGPNGRAQLGHERFYGYIAFTRARRRLVLTCAAQDANDRALNPSPFLAHLRRLFPGLQIEHHSAARDWRDAEHVCELIAPLLQAQCAAQARQANDRGQATRGGRGPGDLGLTGLLSLPALASLQEPLSALASYSPGESLSPQLAERLYGPVLRGSVSALEHFAACPFRFLVHAGLRAEERRVFEADARQQGIFQHEVLAEFHRQVQAENRQWRDLTPREARDRVGRIARERIDQFADGLLRPGGPNAFAARSLVAALEDFIETFMGWMPHYGFDPRAAELSFGRDGDPLPPWEIDLGNGRRMAFRGTIDRVDLAAGRNDEETFCVVVDYKSGWKKIDPLLLEHGVQIQLPAYLAALRQFPGPHPILGVRRLIPAGVFYVSLRGNYQGGRNRSEVLADADATRRLAYRHAGRINQDALPQLDRSGPNGNSGQFNYALTKEGTPNRRYADLLEPQEFLALLDRVEQLLQEMGRRIFAGDCKVDPYRKGSETACDRCDYRAVCRIDPWTHPFRVLKKGV